jgi:ribosomal protein S18 acetylase RimI-like enzyme
MREGPDPVELLQPVKHGEAVTLSFRTARPSDLTALLGLVQAAYRGEESREGWTTEADLIGGQRTDAEEILGIIGGPTSRMLVAESGGELVGCCQLQVGEDGTAYLGMFSVRPRRQGSGLGRAIMAEAERIAADEWSAARMRMLVLRQRDELISWYERLGYRRTGRTTPFPYGEARFGLPKIDDLEFVELAKSLPSASRHPSPPAAAGAPSQQVSRYPQNRQR